MVEMILFYLLAFVLFVYFFLKMIQKNDTNYLYILLISSLGIAITFICLTAKIELNIGNIILSYIFSIIFPICLIIIEKKGIVLTEIIYLTKYNIYSKINNEEKAKEALLKLVEKNNKSFYAHKYLAQIYEKEEQYNVALEEYIRAEELKSTDNQIKYKMAWLYNKCEMPDKSIEILQKLLKENPKMQQASNLLGDIFQEQERFKEAANVYLEAVKYNPEDYDLYYNLGIVYTRLNDFQSAKEYYEKAAELNSLLYNAKFNLGQIELLYNEIDEAQEYFTQCLQNEYLETDSYYYLAYISMLKGEEENAINYLNIAVSESPRLYEKIKKEIIFRIIFNKIEKPKNNGKKKIHTNIKMKEKLAIKHLKKTYELVGNLNNNDYKAMKIIQTKRREENQKERE